MYTFKEELWSESLYEWKCPYAMSPVGVVLHDTANDATAQQEVNYRKQSSLQYEYSSIHVFIDDTEAIQMTLLGRNSWHANDGSQGFANRHLISVEVCYTSPDETSWAQNQAKFELANDNRCRYVAQLHIDCGWGEPKLAEQINGEWVGTLFMHQWFASTACPYRTKPIIDSVVAKIKEYYAELTGTTVEPLSPDPIIIFFGPMSGGDLTTMKTAFEDLSIPYTEENGVLTSTVEVSAGDQIALITVAERLGNIPYGIACDDVPTDCDDIAAENTALKAEIASLTQELNLYKQAVTDIRAAIATLPE